MSSDKRSPSSRGIEPRPLLLLLVSICVLIPATLSNPANTKIQSAVLELNDRFSEVKDDGIWFVKFYAPWCGHCKQLAPIWEQIGHALAETPVRVAKVDCTRFTNVANEFSVHAFPTLKFFRNGESFDYEGERSKEALIDFAMKASGPPVRPLDSRDAFKSASKEHAKTPFFVFVHDEGGLDDSDTLNLEYQQAATSLQTKSFFYKANVAHVFEDDKRSKELPAVVCFKDDTHYIFPQDSEGPLVAWLNAERWPLYPRVGYGNLRDIGGCCNRMLVLTVSDMGKRKKARTETAVFDALVQRVASTYAHDPVLEDKFQFGWLDGNELASSIVLGHMPIPSILVFNYTSNQFFLPDDTPKMMTEHSLVVWLQQIMNQERMPLGGRGFLQRIKRMCYEIITTVYNMFATQPLLTCCLFGLPAGILAIICYSMCSADFSIEHEDVYPEDEESDYSDDEHEKRD